MRTATVIIIALLVMACKKPSMSSPAPTPSLNVTFVPIWRADTMYNGYRVNVSDTLVAFMNGDTSGIMNHDTVLYVFGYNFDTTKSSCFTVWIGADPLDTTTAYSKCVVSYYRYFSTGSNKAKYQQQSIGINTRYPHFSTAGDSYYFGR
jgi:hypothetical protein